MKSNRWLLLIFLLLLAAASLVYFKWYAKEDQPVQEYKRSFSTSNTKDIEKVFFADKQGHRIKLTRKNNTWILNDSFPARENAVNLLLETCEKMKIKYVPTKASLKTIIKDLAVNGIKIELYTANDKKLKSFYLGGTSPNGEGTYAIMEGAEDPFVLEIPGFIGDLRPRFFLDPDEWKDRTVFQLELDSIQQVNVEYTGKPEFSFQVIRNAKAFEVKALDPKNQRNSDLAKKGNIDAFLYGFENQIAEAVVTEDPELKDLDQRVPFVTYKVQTTGGRNMQLKLYPIIPEGQTMADVNLENKTIERYHALSGTGEKYLVQTLNFKKILWAYSFFFENLGQTGAAPNN